VTQGPTFVCLQKESVRRPNSPGLVVGAYADAFVGCRRVAELGAGRGVFLDALALREVPGVGLDADPELAASAVARGHQVRFADATLLAEVVRGCDGVFLGHAVQALTDAPMHDLFAALRATLPSRARIVVRVERQRAISLRAAIDRQQWAMVRCAEVPADGRDVCLVLITGDGGAPARSFPAIAVTARGTAIEAPLRDPFDLERFERRVHSQGGEDGVLEALFGLLGTTNRYYVEFGCGDGVQCNTAALRRRGWQGLLMDGVSAPGAADAVIHAAWITAENIEALFDQHGVPDEPDLMSIDLDGNDYWVWRAIRRRPRVIVAEYNANLAADRALTIPYDPQHRWAGTDFYGASLLALVQVGREKGYTLVYCTQAGVNAFFVRDDVLGLPRVDPEALYRPPNYWYRAARSVPDLSRSLQSV